MLYLTFLMLTGIGYLAGSICSAIIVSNIFSLPDPRTEGSTNPGATNVLRLAGKKYASIVLIMDMLKGLLPVLLAQALQVNYAILGFTCLATVVGHVYPVFFKFKGGKGVATALGALLGLNFIMGIVLIALWLLVANFTRYASLASIITMVIAPFSTIFSTRSIDAFPPVVLLCILVLYKHRKNVSRLFNGQEPKIKLKHHQLSDVAEAMMADKDEAPSQAPLRKPNDNLPNDHSNTPV